MEVAAAHLDDGAETAIVGAAAGGLDDVGLAAVHGVAGEDPGGAVGEAELLVGEIADAAVGVVAEGVAVAPGEAGDGLGPLPCFERADEQAEGDLAFAANEVVDGGFVVGVDVAGQAGVVAADDDGHAGLEGAEERHDREGGVALEGHDGEADDVRVDLVHEAAEGRFDGGLDQDEVGDGDGVVRVEVAGERGERAVGHADGADGHVFERVRHR